MQIIFGTYSFKLKSFQPAELGYKNEQLPDTSFEIRQRVFHLFWIPVFSLGKIYTVRKHDQLLDIPVEQKNLMRSKGKFRTPWYSYSLLILIVIGYFSYLGYEKFRLYERRSNWEASFEKSIEQLDKDFNTLDTNCYIQIRDQHHFTQSKGTYLKVEEIKGQQFLFSYVHTGADNYKKESIRNYYLKHKDELMKISLTLDELKKGICRDINQYNNYSCPGVNLLQDANEYYIESVIRF